MVSQERVGIASVVPRTDWLNVVKYGIDWGGAWSRPNPKMIHYKYNKIVNENIIVKSIDDILKKPAWNVCRSMSKIAIVWTYFLITLCF